VTDTSDEAVDSDEKEGGSAPSLLAFLSMATGIFSLLIAGTSAFLAYGSRVDTLRTDVVEDL
jgi:hypothetical protein